MRKLLILFFAASLFIACNNNKKDDRRSTRDRERDDYRDREDERKDDSRTTDYKDDRDTRDREDDRKTESAGWSRSEENKFVDDCVREAEKNVSSSRAREYCDCMLGKLKRMYSSYDEAEKELAGSGQDDISRLAADCNGQ